MDLSTTYLNLLLKNPLVPSSSPLSRDLGRLRQMEDAGAGAVVLHSLFSEQYYQKPDNVPIPGAEGSDYQGNVDEYAEFIRRAKDTIDIPVIASLNGGSIGGWVNCGKQIEQAGADALELNIYFIPANLEMTSEFVEQVYVELLRQMKAVVSIPIAVKLGPYFSNLANLTRRLVETGADGLVLFNRFYQPDLDIETMQITPKIELSTSAELRLPLRWMAILYGRLAADLALTTGIHTPVDVVKGIAAGATVTMMASELLKNGINRLRVLEAGLKSWLEQHNYQSVAELRGTLSLASEERLVAQERANYLRVLNSYSPGDPWRFGALGLKPLDNL